MAQSAYKRQDFFLQRFFINWADMFVGYAAITANDECENGGDKLVHGSGGIFPAAGGIKPCHL
ncbi:MAG: hypothetical protein HOE98_13245 [Rhodospirillaceae bacterium]|nr:hypothetical protein [Rhodospirillaceae bacterium]MBT3977401.1 hypothetical protein [Rhodospirillaceae bacterium]MBT4561721.1 hypothetical protein [Rhodospirillaceae bacterium]MBT6679510.1 hypothetical protein [Rhodospirillaceae bacterium]MBT7158375.1 hypothetical protein [Rhodospirillaceae bacterium]